jgi:hypothetical protein
MIWLRVPKNAKHAVEKLSIEKDKTTKYFTNVFKTDNIVFHILCCDTEGKTAFPESLKNKRSIPSIHHYLLNITTSFLAQNFTVMKVRA